MRTTLPLISKLAKRFTAVLAALASLPLAASRGAEPVAAAAEVLLDGIERTIVKEPQYVSRPRYALLVMGTKAESKLWMVEDGKTLYLDLNANGDLTDDGPPLVPSEIEKLNGNSFQFAYLAASIKPSSGGEHTSFRLARWNYGDPKDSYGLAISLNGQTPMYAGWFSTFWSDTPQGVPIVHFGGPLQPKLLRFKELTLGTAPTRLSIDFMNPGRGEGAVSRLSINALPPELVPVVTIDWPVAEGAPAISKSHALQQRCCYWEFYDPTFFIPEGVAPGTAKATVSLSAEGFPFELTTNRFEFPVRAKADAKSPK